MRPIASSPLAAVAPSLAFPRPQRPPRPLRKRHNSIAIFNAAAAAAAAPAFACPLDDENDDDDDDENSVAPKKNLPLLGRRVLITAPRSYAASLGARLLSAGARPLSLPGVRTLRLRKGSREEAELDAALGELLSLGRGGGPFSKSSPSPNAPSSKPPPFAAVAFTSRAGIEAVLERVAAIVGASSEESCRRREDVLAAGGAALAAAASAAAASSTSSPSPSFSLWALGADAEALALAGVPAALIKTPTEASTAGMVSAMARQGKEKEEERDGGYENERILVPVPLVVGGLSEPNVVPRFLKALKERVGAVPVRVAAYSTAPPADARRREGGRRDEGDGRAAGLSSVAVAPSAAAELSLLSAGEIDAVVFSSTAEAQGLAMAAGGVEELLGMLASGNAARREKTRRQKRREEGGGLDLDLDLDDLDENDGNEDIVLAAHGPYTAAGASEVLFGGGGGAQQISVVPEDFSSFAGVVGALEEAFRRRRR